MHRYHLTWSRDGTWEAICDRLRRLAREQIGRDEEPSAGVIDARSARGAATVTAPNRGHDAGRKISGRKTFGVVDTTGLLLRVLVVAASMSDNLGGSGVMDRVVDKAGRLVKVFCDGGFKRAFGEHCEALGVTAEVVNRTAVGRFEVLPKRWVVERTWSWLMNNRRLQVDDERDPKVAEGFVWAAHARLLLWRLTEGPVAPRAG